MGFNSINKICLEKRILNIEIENLTRLRNEFKNNIIESEKMVLTAIDKTATNLLTPIGGITDYEIITGNKKFTYDKFDEFKETLKTEIEKEYGLEDEKEDDLKILSLYIQEYLNIAINAAVKDKFRFTSNAYEISMMYV